MVCWVWKSMCSGCNFPRRVRDDRLYFISIRLSFYFNNQFEFIIKINHKSNRISMCGRMQNELAFFCFHIRVDFDGHQMNYCISCHSNNQTNSIAYLSFLFLNLNKIQNRAYKTIIWIVNLIQFRKLFPSIHVLILIVLRWLRLVQWITVSVWRFQINFLYFNVKTAVPLRRGELKCFMVKRRWELRKMFSNCVERISMFINHHAQAKIPWFPDDGTSIYFGILWDFFYVWCDDEWKSGFRPGSQISQRNLMRYILTLNINLLDGGLVGNSIKDAS